MKQKELINKSNISNLVNNSDLSTKLAALEKKAKLKIEQGKLVKLQVLYSGYFDGKNIFVDDRFQNVFVCHTTFNMLELQKEKVTEHDIGWESKGVYINVLHYTSKHNMMSF